MGFPKNASWPDEVFKMRPNSVVGVFEFANRIFYQPMPIFARHTFTAIKGRTNANTTGNWDVGIYDANFNALWRKGSGLVPAGNTNFSVAVPNLVLNLGIYYLAWCFDTGGINNNFISTNVQGMAGFRTQDTYPLPAIGTPVVLNGQGSTSGQMIPLLTAR